MTTSPKVLRIWSSDGIIFNLNDIVIEMCSSMAKQQDIVLDNEFEGPCLRSLGYKQDINLLSIIEKCCQRFNYDKKKITYATSNLIEDRGLLPNITYNFHNNKGNLFFAWQNKIKNFDKDLKYHFGSFIQHSTYPRLFFGSLLHDQYRDKSLYSYRRDLADPIHACNMDLEQFFFNFLDKKYFPQLNKLISDLPIQVLASDCNDHLADDLIGSYSKFFVDIVTETYFTGDLFFLSEKTARPLATKTPFLLFGAKHTLKHLRQIGFQTFDKFWSESYDGAEGALRCQMMSAVIENISKMPVDRLKYLYNRMLPVLEHNYKLYNSIDADVVKKCFGIGDRQ